MTKHDLDYELCPSGHWGWCSCGNWSTGAIQRDDDDEGEAEVRGQWNSHVERERWAEVEDGLADFNWDRPEEWESGEALTREEVLASR